ncbi:uncharacterized protein [Antedon mediterranea]|uniref:uncharacterized protein n=1 Tax=Antedon mediterranea TaxID=105859 RepID=UPI003AF5B264
MSVRLGFFILFICFCSTLIVGQAPGSSDRETDGDRSSGGQPDGQGPSSGDDRRADGGSTGGQPGGGGSTDRQPGGGGSTGGQPGGGGSTGGQPGGGGSTDRQPGGGGSTDRQHGGGDSTDRQPGGGGSTGGQPGGGGSSGGQPGGGGSTGGQPGGSTDRQPGGGDSTDRQPGGGGSTGGQPGGGGSSGGQPGGGGSTGGQPGGGGSTDRQPGGGGSTDRQPGGGGSTGGQPGGGGLTGGQPGGGGSTGSQPGGGGSTAGQPGGGGSTGGQPGGGGSTDRQPGGGGSSGGQPGGGGSTGGQPGAGGSTDRQPGGEGSSGGQPGGGGSTGGQPGGEGSTGGQPGGGGTTDRQPGGGGSSGGQPGGGGSTGGQPGGGGSTGGQPGGGGSTGGQPGGGGSTDRQPGGGGSTGGQPGGGGSTGGQPGGGGSTGGQPGGGGSTGGQPGGGGSTDGQPGGGGSTDRQPGGGGSTGGQPGGGGSSGGQPGGQSGNSGSDGDTPPSRGRPSIGGRNPTERQISECDVETDCNGDCGGTAVLNDCELCVGGNTNRGRDAGKDSCGECQVSGTDTIIMHTTKDCHGTCNGNARSDKCGECVGGETGLAVDKNSHRINCKGVCELEGTFSYGENDCGDCVRVGPDGIIPSAADCNGACTNGRNRARIDKECGICVVRGEPVKNECGVCLNAPEEEKTKCNGCDNVPNSGLVEDACGICDGDGSSCQVIKSVEPALLPNSGTQQITIHGAGFDSSNVRVSRNVRRNEITNCMLSSTTSNDVIVEWPVTDVTNTAVTCQSSEGETLEQDVYDVAVISRDGDEINGTEPITISVYEPPTVVSVEPREFDAIKGRSLEFELQVTLESGARLNDYDGLVPKLIVRGDQLKKVLDVAGGSRDFAVLDGRVVSNTKMNFSFEFKKCSSKSFMIQPSLDGRHPLTDRNNNEDGFRVTVYTVGPKLSSILMTNNEDRLKVRFDKKVENVGLDNCTLIFEDSNRLGVKAECKWNSLQSLIVQLGKNHNIIPNITMMRVLEGAIRGYGAENSRESARKPVVVQPPRNPKPPIAICELPSEISACSKGLELRGDKSRGTGLLKYLWFIRAVNGSINTDALQMVLDRHNGRNEGKGEKAFTFTANFTHDVDYEITLVVEKSLGLRHNVSRRFRQTSDAKPTVTIKVKEGDVQAGRVYQPILLNAKVKYDMTCFPVGDTVFKWDWNKDDVRYIDEKSRISENRIFRIPKFGLKGGMTTRFNVTVYKKEEPSKVATDFIDVTTVASDLKARIKGGKSSQYGCSSGEVMLDGSGSKDPDKDDLEMVYTWTCEQTIDSRPCFSYREGENNIEFPSNEQRSNSTIRFYSEQMTPGVEYTFTLIVQKGSRFHSTNVTRSCSEDDLLKVDLILMKNDDGVYSIQDNIDIKAKIRGDLTISNFTWETDVSGEDAYGFMDLEDPKNFRVPPKISSTQRCSTVHLNLKPGVVAEDAKYLIKFTASSQDGRTGTSTIEIKTNRGIRNCEITAQDEVNPPFKFLVNVTGCVADEDNYPLNYQALIEDTSSSDTSIISQATNDASFDAVAGQTDFKLLVKICDARKKCINKKKPITTVATALSEEEGQEYYFINVENEVMKGALLKATISLTSLIENFFDGARRRKRDVASSCDSRLLQEYGEMQAYMLKRAQSDENLGSNDRKAFLDQTKYLAYPCMNKTSKLDTIRSIRDLVSVNVDESSDDEPIDKDTARNVFDSLSEAASGIHPQGEDWKLNDELRLARQSVSKEILRGLAFGEKFEKETSDSKISIMRTQLTETVQSHSGEGSISVNFGNALREKYGTDWACADGKTCSDVSVKMLQYTIDYTSVSVEDAQTLIADVIDVALADPETGEELDVSDLETPVTIVIPIRDEIPEGKRAVAKYMDKNTWTWKKDGIETTISDDKRLVTCMATHLTEFTVAVEDIEEQVTGTVGGGTVGGGTAGGGTAGGGTVGGGTAGGGTAGGGTAGGGTVGGGTVGGGTAGGGTVGAYDASVGTESPGGQVEENGGDETNDLDVEDADDEDDASTATIIAVSVVIVAAFIIVIIACVIVMTKVKKRKQVSPTPSKENVQR